MNFKAAQDGGLGNSSVSHMKNDGPLSHNRVHASGWIRIAKPAFFATWDFVRFVGESTSLQPSVPQTVGRHNKVYMKGFKMSENSYDYSTRTGVHSISWEDFHGICKALALSVSHFQPEVILPIGRGGYYPGTLLAHLLQIEIYPVRISRRINDVVKYNEPQWIITPPAEIVHRRVLVVDEICDSGETILIVKEKCLALGAALAKSAVLYAHTKAVGVPDYIGIITDELLMNPWDREVFRDGEFQFNPEYVDALRQQGVEAKSELLIPAKVFRLAKEESRPTQRATDGGYAPRF